MRVTLNNSKFYKNEPPIKPTTTLSAKVGNEILRTCSLFNLNELTSTKGNELKSFKALGAFKRLKPP